MQRLLSRLKHTHPSYGLVAVIIAVSLLSDNPAAFIADMLKPLSAMMNELVLASVGVLLLLALLLILSPAGQIKLGKPDEAPHFSTTAWLAMLFAAGMGTGLVFSGFAEPLLHASNLPAEGNIVQTSARQHAMLITFYHWGLHAWAVYGLAALAVAYFSYCKDQPMLASAPLNYLFKKPLPIKLRQLIDAIAIIAALFGIAASLAQGVWLVERGLGRFGMEQVGAGWILLLIVTGFILSAISGIGRGIKWLSIINMVVAFGLLLLVWWISQVPLITNIGEYVSHYVMHLPRLSIDSQALSGDGNWLAIWPSAYMIWWVAWTPFVGIFIARISRGYTIRRFMLGVLLAPVAFSLVWFTIFANTAFSVADMKISADIYALSDMPAMGFAVLEALPYAALTMSLVMVLITIFLITSADSGSYILAMFSHDGALKPPRISRISWGMGIALIAGWLVFQPDGMPFIRQIIVITALPFLLIVWLQVIALLQAIYRVVRR